MNITLALTQETTATAESTAATSERMERRNFFRCLASNVESGRREQVSDARFEIERSIFAEPRQYSAYVFVVQQSDIRSGGARGDRAPEIATEIVSHD